MSNLNISLSEHLADFVNAKVSAGQFSDANAYVEALIRADQRKVVQSHYESECKKGDESGSAGVLDAAAWDAMYDEAMTRLDSDSAQGRLPD